MCIRDRGKDRRHYGKVGEWARYAGLRHVSERDPEADGLLTYTACRARWLIRKHALAVKGGSVEATAARTVAASALWPHRDFKTFEAALFSLLAWTDSLIAQDTFQDIVTA